MSRHDDHDLFDDDLGRDPFADPVARFFAQEREEIEELPGHDLHFQGIVRSARPARRRARRLAVGAAAAAVAVAVLAAVVTLRPGEPELMPAAPPSTVSLPEPSAPTTPAPVSREPSDGEFLPRSVSAGDGSTRAVLGSARCTADSSCPVILRTSDDGAQWINTAALPDLTVAPPGGIATAPGQVGILRWADSDVGYLAGSTLRRTTDGGTTWAEMPHPGGTIIALEIGDGIVRLVSAGECTDEGCSGPLKVYQAGTGDTVADVVTLDADITGITDAQLVVRGSAGFLAVHTGTGTRAFRLGATSEELAPCGSGGARTWFATPATGEGPLAALCGTDDGEVSLRTSEDDGTTWSDLSGSAKVPGQVSGLTSPEPGTFVLTVRTPDGFGQVLRSADDGRTWSPASADPVRWSWVAAGGDNRVYGLADDSEGFLESLDGGQTWRTQVLAP